MNRADESSHFAFHELVALAHADRGINASENEALDRFARHLGIPARKARRYRRLSKRRAREFPTDPQRQLDLLKMLARIAFADGALQAGEQQFFARLCAEFGIPRTRLAHVLEEAETTAQRRRHLDRRWFCAGGLGAALVGGLWWIQAHSQPDEMTGFKTLDRELRASLLLVHTRCRLRHSSLPQRWFSATGTAFFVSEDGLALTNKHVLQPWRFLGKGTEYLAAGYELVPGSVEVLAWREGTTVLDPAGKPITQSAYSTSKGSLSVIGWAPDAALPEGRRPKNLRRSNIFCHANDNGDLALLRCVVDEAVPAVDLAEHSTDVTRLDPVMVLGYPRGLNLLETARAISSPSVGRVRKSEDTIYVTAPVVGGNSGGPLLDRHGHVIGIATRTGGTATLACCLRIEHGRRLIEQAR